MFIPLSVAALLCSAIWQPVLVWGFCAILMAVLFALIVQMTQAIHKRKVVARRSVSNDPSRMGTPVSSTHSELSASDKLLRAQNEVLRRSPAR